MNQPGNRARKIIAAAVIGAFAVLGVSLPAAAAGAAPVPAASAAPAGCGIVGCT
jgi:hypothetical protein